MEQLIKIHSENGRRAVSAKELYNFLSIDNGNHFAEWSQRNIIELFTQDVDYQILPHDGGNPGRPSIDYALSLDASKEIAMMSRCEKGKTARQYFIEIEKQWLSGIAHLPNFNDPVIAARAWADELEKRQIAENKALMLEQENKKQEQIIINKNIQIRQAEPKIEFYRDVAEDGALYPISMVCKLLNLPFGRNTLLKKLRQDGIFFNNRNEPKQQYSMAGSAYFDMKSKITNGNFTVRYVVATGKGMEFLHKRYGQHQQSMEL